MDTEETQQALQQWVEQQIARLPSISLDPAATAVRMQPLGGDAGFRCYSRVNSHPSALAVLAPVSSENSRAFVAIARSLRRCDIAAPEVYAADFDQGFLLLQDLGEHLLGDVLKPGNVDQLYADAMQILLRLQACPERVLPVAPGQADYRLPDYDRVRLHSEMMLLQQWFIPRLLGLQITAAQQQMLEQLYQTLEDSALQQPQVWVHRDFHSRNLIHRTGRPAGVIDFQDAVFGPLTYDLVSLLRDCYLRWPAEQVRAWLAQYHQLALQAGLLPDGNSIAEFERWFDWMGLQRHIKVLGIFARLWLRDGKSRYLHDLPLVLRYTLEVADKYEEFSDFRDYLRDCLLPRCEQQGWYRDIATAGQQL